MSLGIWLKIPACEHCGNDAHEVWGRSPTYNLYPMWKEAGCPFEEGIEGKLGIELVPALEASLANLKADPSKFKAMNPANGWGNYEELVDVVETMIEAAKKYPKAKVGTWR